MGAERVIHMAALPEDLSAEQTAEEVFRNNKALIEGVEPIEDLKDAIADEHEMMERRCAGLDRRLKSLERKGMFRIENQDQVLFYLAIAYFTFAFIVPAVRELLLEGETK